MRLPRSLQALSQGRESVARRRSERIGLHQDHQALASLQRGRCVEPGEARPPCAAVFGDGRMWLSGPGTLSATKTQPPAFPAHVLAVFAALALELRNAGCKRAPGAAAAPADACSRSTRCRRAAAERVANALELLFSLDEPASLHAGPRAGADVADVHHEGEPLAHSSGRSPRPGARPRPRCTARRQARRTRARPPDGAAAAHAPARTRETGTDHVFRGPG